MKKIYSKLLLILLVVFILLFSVITISYLNHKLQLNKEKHLIIAPGKIVEVNGHDMHVYNEGQGEESLVFLAGGGTASPFLDFKSLYSELSHKYEIAVVEKAGYGFSELTRNRRDIDTILDDSRKALQKAGIQPPYILFAHSMSGIEALYWSQKFPQEVKAIIGLDMAVPNAYDDYPINKFIVNLSAFGARIGITRFIPEVVNDSAAIKIGSLTDNEKDLYRAVFYLKTMTAPMTNEIYNIKDNAIKVAENGYVNTPLLFLISNGNETGFSEADWIKYQTDYIDNSNHDSSKYIKYDYPHYIHNYNYKEIAIESRNFIEEIISLKK